MQLTSGGEIPDGLLAANALLAENSRQGFGASTHTLYQGFGVAISNTALGSNRSLYDGGVESRYTGKERDAESGNDYFGARYYGSNMGRFMSPDPSGLSYADPTNPQSFNLYSYVLNNPLVNTDPTGLDCVHINNDTGAFEGFESGDCDNSTEEKANSGYYIDGTVNQISFNAQNQVQGYSASTSDGVFGTPGSNADSGPAAFSLNPYTTFLSTNQSISVTAGSSDPLSLLPASQSQSFLDRTISRYNQLWDRIPDSAACIAPQTAMETRDAINTVRGGRSQPGPNTDSGSPGVPFMPNNNRSPKNGGNPKTGGQSASSTNTGDKAANAGAMTLQYVVNAGLCYSGSR